jgi:hypothetical protein
MLNRVNEKTCVVEVSREASTVEAMRAAFVDKDDGNGAARTAPLTGASVELEGKFESLDETIVDLDFEGMYRPP